MSETNVCGRCGHSVHRHEDEGSAPCYDCACDGYEGDEDREGS
jgi:hypothetical protein